MKTELRAQSTELTARSGRSYRDLKAWQRSIELSVAVYQLTADFPRDEVYGLTSQLRRCSVSVASNLAEGYGRASRGEIRQFVGTARGSVLELQTQLVIAGKLGFGKPIQRNSVDKLAEELGKMTWALMQKL